MKRILSVFAIVLLLTPFFAQQAEANSYGIRVSPITLLVGAVDVSVDISLGNWVVSPEATLWNLDLGTSSTKLNAYGASLSYHFSGALVDSWYLGANAKMIGVEISNSTETGKLDTTYVGARAGYLWVWSTFYMNLGASFGTLGDNSVVITNTNTTATRTETVPLAGLGVGLDFKIGFSF